MDILSGFGILVILAGMGGLAYVVLGRKGSFSMPLMSRSRSAEPITRFAPPPSRSEELVRSSAGQTVTLLGEPERAILASVTLNEMFQRSPQSSWEATGAVSKALALAGGIWVFKVPSREGGKSTWLRATELDTPALAPFYKGNDRSPGPARQFKENGQTDPVPYTLPRDLTPGVTWEIVDIGRFHTEVDGQSDNVINGDKFPFVTSREQGGARWLLYLDARKENAKGPGGLFLAEPFEPSVDVTDLM